MRDNLCIMSSGFEIVDRCHCTGFMLSTRWTSYLTARTLLSVGNWTFKWTQHLHWVSPIPRYRYFSGSIFISHSKIPWLYSNKKIHILKITIGLYNILIVMYIVQMNYATEICLNQNNNGFAHL